MARVNHPGAATPAPAPSYHRRLLRPGPLLGPYRQVYVAVAPPVVQQEFCSIPSTISRPRPRRIGADMRTLPERSRAAATANFNSLPTPQLSLCSSTIRKPNQQRGVERRHRSAWQAARGEIYTWVTPQRSAERSAPCEVSRQHSARWHTGGQQGSQPETRNPLRRWSEGIFSVGVSGRYLKQWEPDWLKTVIAKIQAAPARRPGKTDGSTVRPRRLDRRLSQAEVPPLSRRADYLVPAGTR